MHGSRIAWESARQWASERLLPDLPTFQALTYLPPAMLSVGAHHPETGYEHEASDPAAS